MRLLRINIKSHFSIEIINEIEIVPFKGYDTWYKYCFGWLCFIVKVGER